MSTTTNTIEIKPYSITELSRIYGVTLHTMRKWLKPHLAVIGEKQGRLYTTLQTKIIFEKLGLPGIIQD
jgi:transposase-like protein